MDTMPAVLDQAHGPNWSLYNGDSCEVLKGIPDKSVGLTVYSPPFANLYTYSDSERDMGNCEDDAEFMRHYSFIAHELLRVTKPGRLCVVHCADLPMFKWRDGTTGARDFSGDLIRCHSDAGWSFLRRVTIWKDPVTEMQRTKSHNLLYKELRKDTTGSYPCQPDYLLLFKRAPRGDEKPTPVPHTSNEIPLELWQQWASPVWMDIDQSDTLNARMARGEKDERHMCPLQLPTIRRAVIMWSNPGDVVLTPFLGIGSEVKVAVENGRHGVGIELKPEYFRIAVQNVKAAGAQGKLL